MASPSWPRWVLVYALISLPPYFLPAYVPDEEWFLRVARDLDGSYFEQQPLLGYGSLFWSAYATILKVVPAEQALLLMRAVSYWMMLSIPVALVHEGERNGSRHVDQALAFWFLMPIAWWYGKLVSPEIPSIALCVWAHLLLGCRSTWAWAAGWMMWGLAVGLKVTVLPTVMFLLPVAAWRHGLSAVAFAWLAAPGFLLANPGMALAPREFAAAFTGSATPISFDPAILYRALLDPFWEWDGIPAGGMFAHGLALPAAVVLISLLARVVVCDKEDRLVASAALGMLAATILLTLRERFLTWYVFPTLTLLPFAVVALSGRRARLERWLGAVLVAQALCGVPLIAKQYGVKIWHMVNVAHAEEHDRAVRALLQQWKPDLVIDALETTGDPRFSLTERKGTPVVDELKCGFRCRDPRYERRVLILIGDRLAFVHGPYQTVPERAQDPNWTFGYRLIRTVRVGCGTGYLFDAVEPRPPDASP